MTTPLESLKALVEANSTCCDKGDWLADNGPILIERMERMQRAISEFYTAFKEHGYGETSTMSYPDEWADLISIGKTLGAKMED